MKRVGIYSGTFDPIHVGHLAFAREALEQCRLDKVFFLTEPRPRRKQGVKAFEHRLRMVQLAIKDDPKFGSIVLDQQRFTPLETLPVLSERFKDAQLFMLMGDDALNHFAGGDWPHVDYLVKNISFVIGLRHYKHSDVEQRIRVLEQTQGWTMRYQLFQAARPEFASTTIKQDLRNGNVAQGLPPAVADYIRENGLYSSSTES